MKRILMIAVVSAMSMIMSCAIFISDNDDDDDDGRRNSSSSKDTITIIYSQTKGNPLSAQ